jgi:hypothetical protein
MVDWKVVEWLHKTMHNYSSRVIILIERRNNVEPSRLFLFQLNHTKVVDKWRQTSMVQVLPSDGMVGSSQTLKRPGISTRSCQKATLPSCVTFKLACMKYRYTDAIWQKCWHSSSLNHDLCSGVTSKVCGGTGILTRVWDLDWKPSAL